MRGQLALRRRGRNTLALVIAVTAAFLLLGLSVEAGHEGTKSWLASRAAGSHRRLLQDGSSEFLLPSALASGSSAPPPPPGAKHFSGVQKFLVVFYILGVLYCLLGFAIVCEDYFVASLIAIGDKFHLSDDVMGATLMAAGSSLPEVFSSLVALYNPNTDNALGMATVCGSSVYNILIIIGWSAIAGKDVMLDWKPLLRDSLFYFITIIYLLGTFSGGAIGLVQSFVALSLYCLYVGFMTQNKKAFAKMDELAAKHSPYLAGKTEERLARKGVAPVGAFSSPPNGDPQHAHLATELLPVLEFDSLSKEEMGTEMSAGAPPANGSHLPPPPPPPPGSGPPPPGAGAPSGDDGEGGLGAHGEHVGASLVFPKDGTLRDKAQFCVKAPLVVAFMYTIPDCRTPRWSRYYWLTFAASIVWIGILANYMVEWASHIACVMNIPAIIVGLTVLAAGTSLPDTLSSVIVARKGLGDMAVANAIGSNVFNVLFGLGFPWTLYMLTHGGHPIVLGSSGLLENAVTMFFVGVFYMVVFFSRGLRMTTKLGYVFIAVYAAYVLMVIIRFSSQPPDPQCV